MTWAIFILVGLVIFGSVYWLKPSARDTRLAELRMQAIKLGLHVRQHKFEPDSAKTGVRDSVSGTSYSWMRPDARTPGDLEFSIVGQPAWENTGLPEGLYWHQRPTLSEQEAQSSEAFEKYQQACEQVGNRIRPLLEVFEDDILLLEVYENRVLIIPAENKVGTAEAYSDLIKQLLA